MKEQFRSVDSSKQVVGVTFGIFTAEEMRQQSSVQVVSKNLYTQDGKNQPAPYGVLDLRMGVCTKDKTCETCGSQLADCPGHYGYIDLQLPVFHIGYFTAIQQTLNSVCKFCSRILLTDEECRNFTAMLRRPGLSYLQRKNIRKRIYERCKPPASKITECPHCHQLNGVVRKTSLLQIGHLLDIASTIAKPRGKSAPGAMSKEVVAVEASPANSCLRGVENLNPLIVLEIFRRIPEKDIPLLLMSNEFSRPESMILTRILVPPVCIRPSVSSDIKAGTTEDDITMKLTEILLLNEVIQKHRETGAKMGLIAEDWDFLQLQVALLYNSQTSGIPANMQPKKWMRGFCQRLKGKHGRFRGNLSGKRVDFSGRTVISPDPNIPIDRIAIPIEVAKILTFPECVNNANKKMLQELVINGGDVHPGANFIQPRNPSEPKKFLRYGDRRQMATELQNGDIVERHLKDGDIVLFNRQPSLHRLSIQAFKIRVLPYRTFRFNECCCTPFNADFDGDEMNIHVPQTQEARAEAATLLASSENILTPRNGEPLTAAIQDFITATYLLTSRDTFIDRAQATQLAASLMRYDEPNARIELPPPAIVRPLCLWTGKQIFSLVIKPSRISTINLNLRAKTKNYSGKDEELCMNDGFVVMQNSELLAGRLDKSSLGSGSKTSFVYVLVRDFGPQSAVIYLTRIARLAPAFLTNYGMSIGIGDVTPGKQLLALKKQLVTDGYARCSEYIEDLKAGRLQTQAGCNPDQTLEAVILKELSAIRDHAGKACLRELPPTNAPLIMALSGSKGSTINISQMVACVGQQALSGKRVPDGFTGRSLPHFRRGDRSPEAKGFVANSFYSGLTPAEFIFHAMGGREGLVDTAVKTAETGYMQRRLVKSLEDLVLSYDGTVRNSDGDVVQFIYGGDGLDPLTLESSSPVDYVRLLQHISNMNPCKGERSLSGSEIKAIMNTWLADQQQKNANSKSAWKLKGVSDIVFRDEIEKFLSGFADKVDKVRATFATQLALGQMPVINQVRRLTEVQLLGFLNECAHRWRKACVEPGTTVGAICAQSIGEPGTQMTLKTFHFAGVASMNITLGVPRLKEIINANKTLSTPIITAELDKPEDPEFARIVKARIEKTRLADICESIDDVYRPKECFILLRLDLARIALLRLRLTASAVAMAIQRAQGNRQLHVRPQTVRVFSECMVAVYPDPTSKGGLAGAMHVLRTELPNITVCGLATAGRVVIEADQKTGKRFRLFVEGDDITGVIATPGVAGNRVTSNSIMAVWRRLGIEAARATIANEINDTMANHGMSIDRRHVDLLSDLMTVRGEVLGITRIGLARLKQSVLMLASFERTTDHLFEASYHGQADALRGVSESVILGQPSAIGTGVIKLMYRANGLKQAPTRKPLLFDLPKYDVQSALVKNTAST